MSATWESVAPSTVGRTTINHFTPLCGVHSDPEGHCGRRAVTRLRVTRPCGHDRTLATCPGHAEALIGSNAPTRCSTCGTTNPATLVPQNKAATPEDAR